MDYDSINQDTELGTLESVVEIGLCVEMNQENVGVMYIRKYPLWEFKKNWCKKAARLIYYWWDLKMLKSRTGCSFASDTVEKLNYLLTNLENGE